MKDLENSYLFKELKKNNNELSGCLLGCWSEAEKLLRHTASCQPDFTSHGPDHALALINILDEIIEPKYEILSLTDPEIYILLSATLLHDIGLVSKVDQTANYRNKIRSEHHILSSFYIMQNAEPLKLKKEFVNAIADVASAHRKIDIENDINERPIINSTPRCKLCCALIRLADECHITSDRVPADYKSLGLNNESKKHFELQDNIIGCVFKHQEKNIEITFSINISTSETDEMFHIFKEKLDSELKSINPIFKKCGINNINAEWCENRDELIKQKIINCLLKNGALTKQQLIDKLDEVAEEVKSFIGKYGESIPFEYDNNSETHYLCKNENAFKEFFSNPNLNALDIINSDIAREILSDAYFDKLIGNCLGDLSKKKVIYNIIRKSPSALQYILNKKDIPKSKLTCTTGLSGSLTSELLNDFNIFPELLLVPELLDKLIEHKLISQKDWQQLKIKQIVEYHNFFEDKLIIEQWAIPNHWENNDSDDESKQQFNISFKSPKEQYENPLLLMAAAQRLKIPLEMQENDDIKIDVDFHNDKIASTINNMKGYAKLSFLPTGQKELKGSIFCTFEKEEGNYILTPNIQKVTNDYHYNKPINLHFELKKGTLNCKFDLNGDFLDCKTAYLIIKAVENSETKIILHDFPIKRKQNEIETDMFRALIPADSKGKKLAKKLAKLQDILECKIEYPFAGLDRKVTDFILSLSFSNKKEAKTALEKIKKCVNEQNKPDLSIAVYEQHQNDIVVNRQLLNINQGLRWPLPNATLVDKENQAKFDTSIKNANYKFVLKNYINISPTAALNYIKEKSISENIVHHGVLTDRITNKICEYKSSMITHNESIEKTLWYNLTYCRAVLSQFESWERWCNEASYFLEVKKDIKRAYIAAKEGYKINNKNKEVKLQFGWCAFHNNRILQAIELTKDLSTSSNEEIRFFTFGNLGLYNLALAKNDIKYLEQVKNNYSGVKKMHNSNKQLPLHIILSDIKTFSNVLHEDYIIYIKQLEPLI